MCTRRDLLLLVVLFGASVLASCRPAWNPPAPRGRNWAYKRQGAYRAFSGTDVSTSGGWRYYRLYFAAGQTHVSRSTSPEQFWQTRFAWDAKLFNAHLGAYGERLEPDEARPSEKLDDVKRVSRERRSKPRLKGRRKPSVRGGGV